MNRDYLIIHHIIIHFKYVFIFERAHYSAMSLIVLPAVSLNILELKGKVSKEIMTWHYALLLLGHLENFPGSAPTALEAKAALCLE